MKKKIIKNMLWPFLFSVKIVVFGQGAATQDLTPKVISPPPNAASLGKYGQIPVGLSNGIPSVTIPIYEIKTSKLSLPISLSYHAAGVKVDEVASMCGLSWSLSAGGVITRSVVGLPDDIGWLVNKPPLGSAITSNPNDYGDYLYGVSQLNSTDSQPDLFFFNFNGMSGKFVFGEENTPIIIPNQNLDVKYVSGNFKITSDDGTVYWFEEREIVTSGVFSQGAEPDQITTNSWYLTRAVSHDGTDEITLTYKSDKRETTELNCLFSAAIGGTVAVSYEGGAIGVTTNVTSTDPAALSGISYRKYIQKLPDEIRFSNGKIQFLTVDDRLDQGVSRLASVKVWQTHGTARVIKETRLEHDYFRSTEKHKYYPDNSSMEHRLKLTRVYDVGSSGNFINEYKMEYEESLPMPPVNSFGQDLWGFNNGYHSNETLIQRQQNISFANGIWQVGNADRSVREVYMETGILKKIHYPTGGYTAFEYEPHSYTYSNKTVVPKLHTIRATGAHIETNILPFTVHNDVITPIIVEAKISKYAYPNVTEMPWVQIRNKITGAEAYRVNAQADANQSIYSQEQLDLQSGTEYELVAYAQGNDQVTAEIEVRYSVATDVVDTRKGGGLRIKKIDNFDGQKKYTSRTYEYSPGQLLSTSHTFDNTTEKIVRVGYNGPGIICTYAYSDYPRRYYSSSTTYPLESFNGSPLGYSMVTEYVGDNIPSGNSGKTEYFFKVVPNSYFPTPIQYQSGRYGVTHSWENGLMTKEINYSYDATDAQFKKIREVTYTHRKITGRKGRGQIVGTKYFISGCQFSGESSQYFWFDYPIESGRYVLDGVMTEEFTPDGNNMVRSVSYTYDTVRYLPIEDVEVNSNGDRIKTINKYPQDFTSMTVYAQMVDRNIVTPVVEKIKMNETRSLELSSLKTEYDFWHNETLIEPKFIKQSFGGDVLQTEVAISRYDPKGRILEYTAKDGIPISFVWGYDNALPIAKLVGIPYSLIQPLLDNGSISRPILVSPTSDAQLRAELSKLKNFFPGKKIIIYTYSPLQGCTSETDENGVTQYYEYDDFNRLKLIRDQFNNIVKTYEYNYKMK